MISYSDIEKLFSFGLAGMGCIEIAFQVKEHPKYQVSYMGKTPIRNGKDLFWYGLMPNGSESYEYETFEDFSSAPVFDGMSLKDLWDQIEILSIDGCVPEDRLQTYL